MTKSDLELSMENLLETVQMNILGPIAHGTLTVPTPARDRGCDCDCGCEATVKAEAAAAHSADTRPLGSPESGNVGNTQARHSARTLSTAQACWACAASIARTMAAFIFIPRHLGKAMCWEPNQ